MVDFEVVVLRGIEDGCSWIAEVAESMSVIEVGTAEEAT